MNNPKIAYFCDGLGCDRYHDSECESEFCNHTTDIKHAKNFEELEDNVYFEKEDEEETSISPEEFAEQMLWIKNNTTIVGKFDQEGCHSRMDYLMEEVLESLGYSEGVEIFRNTPKWYA